MERRRQARSLSVSDCPEQQERPRLHTTQKPVDLMRALISDFTNPGELVLDSHAGSGTTGAACIELGRDHHREDPNTTR